MITGGLIFHNRMMDIDIFFRMYNMDLTSLRFDAIVVLTI